MSVQLNHTIVYCRDKQASAAFLADMLGLAPPVPFGPFMVVTDDSGTSLDFHETDADIQPQHYAFLISEGEFDEVYGRIVDRGLVHWADPFQSRPGEINHDDGGRGVYFLDPDGHFLETLTRPYGSGS